VVFLVVFILYETLKFYAKGRVSFSKLRVVCFRINGVIKKYKKVSVTIICESDHGHGHGDSDVRQKDLVYYR